MEFRPGSLVSLHGREWVVLPGPDEDLIHLRPLGGTDAEVRAVWKELESEYSQIKPYTFDAPDAGQYGDFYSAKLLLNATRLSFRNGAGPFRSLGRLSIRPRAYQIVPLIMALKQETVRLLIADDVGIGKTIESLLIVREMLDRSYIDRFSVLAPPHLCDQWQKEIFDKFAIDAKLVRSSTLSSLERNLLPDESIFDHYPFTVVSIDLIKRDRYKSLFMNKCPPLIICDEAHTCASSSGEYHERYELLSEISGREDKHLLLLTATPHSGKQEHFQNLLGLIKPEFRDVDMTNTSDQRRKEVARHFVQRRRKNVEKWLNEDTNFPERESQDIPYSLTGNYQDVFDEVLEFVRSYTGRETEGAGIRHIRYFTALTLLRGVLSSPYSGSAMLANRVLRLQERPEDSDSEPPEFVVENDDFAEGDFEPLSYFEESKFESEEVRILKSLRKKLDSCIGLTNDRKALTALEIIKKWLREGYNPVVYCRFINTAKYLGEILIPELSKEFSEDFAPEVITSELSDEERSGKVKSLESFGRKIIFATDCMSEGINLQEQFTAVMHYDLPWNPNRIEQREGRIDRFGQVSKKIKLALLYCEDNIVDGTVLNILLKKVREIKRASGIAVPFPENSETILKTVLSAVLLRSSKDERQGKLDFGDEDYVKDLQQRLEKEIQSSADREEAIAGIFAQTSIEPGDIEKDLLEVDQALGKPDDVSEFVLKSLERLSCGSRQEPNGFSLQLGNAEPALRLSLTEQETALVSFKSPTPEKHIYLGRNHPFVEQLCNSIMKDAFSIPARQGIGRYSVIRSGNVDKPVTIYLLRLRLVIRDTTRNAEMLAEEVWIAGFIGKPEDEQHLEFEEASKLITDFTVTEDIENQETRERLLEIALNDFESAHANLMKITEDRTKKLIDAHERFRKAIGGERYDVVEPVLPPDLLGVFLILPVPNL